MNLHELKELVAPLTWTEKADLDFRPDDYCGVWWCYPNPKSESVGKEIWERFEKEQNLERYWDQLDSGCVKEEIGVEFPGEYVWLSRIRLVSTDEGAYGYRSHISGYSYERKEKI